MAKLFNYVAIIVTHKRAPQPNVNRIQTNGEPEQSQKMQDE